MKRQILTLATIGLVLLVLVILMFKTLPGFGDSGCGIQPIKPIPPIGCKDFEAQCICSEDSRGVMHCHWEWLCVK